MDNISSGPANTDAQKWNQAEGHSNDISTDLDDSDDSEGIGIIVNNNTSETYEDIILEQELRIKKLEEVVESLGGLVEALVAEFIPEHNV